MATPRKKTAGRPPRNAKKPAGGASQAARARGAGQAAAGGGSKARSGGPASPDDMSAEVIEFITAVDDYKRIHGRPFPSWSEILDVLKGLGYRKAG
jgi:hypothetical protein